MKFFLTSIILVLTGAALRGQVRGGVSSADGQEIPYVSVTVEGTYNGTTANEEGLYELNLKVGGEYTLVFQSIGFKTEKKTVKINTFPYQLNIMLRDETYQLDEITISNAEDPAYAIIRRAIAAKQQNAAKAKRFEADFYSKANYKLTVPKGFTKEMAGEEILTFLDSSGTGIIYVSETVSRIVFEHPDNLKENIIANKQSGKDFGYSYNTAESTYFTFMMTTSG